MNRIEYKALKNALKLPGMQSHINRMKAAWKNRQPSPDTLYTWATHKVAKGLYTRLLHRPLSHLLTQL
jgi:hypothetical protein